MVIQTKRENTYRYQSNFKPTSPGDAATLFAMVMCCKPGIVRRVLGTTKLSHARSFRDDTIFKFCNPSEV